MAKPKNVGPAPSADSDIATLSLLDTLLTANISQATVDSLLAAGLTTYATKAYVDTQDALNATEDEIDDLDAAKLKLAQRNANNGYAGLDSTGKVDYARVTGGNTQRYPKPFTTPASYNASTVNATTETTVYSTSIADPGYPYKILCFGSMEGLVSVDNGEYPLLRIRVGSTSGTVIATGGGIGERYIGAVQTIITASGTYSPPGYASTVDVVLIGGGAGGTDGGFFFNSGNGGHAGTFVGASLTPGVSFTGSINVNIGTGGTAGGGAGTATTITATGYAGLSGAGGSGTVGSQGGQAAGNYSFNGTSYVGGFGGSGNGGTGGAPGGGGAGGNGGLFGGSNGGAGARGQAWFYARPPGGNANETIATGTATVIPASLTGQTPLTGAQNIFVRLVRTGTTATVSVTNSLPGLYLVPVPA